jgi:putative acetyltransferase
MIRPYADEDLEELLDVWYRASVPAHSFLPEDFFAFAERGLPISETLVYETAGRVVGFVSLIGTEVGGIFVDPDHQRSGVGTALLDAARDIHPVLELSVFAANMMGRRFYEAYGFEEVGRGIEEDTGQPEIRLRFERHESRA